MIIHARNLVPSTTDRALGGSVIERSLRFKSDDDAYLSRTPSSAGNRKTWTWSGWIKFCSTSTGNHVFGGGSNCFNDRTAIFFPSGIINTDLCGVGAHEISDGYFRDFNSWYHFVWAFDTTQATASNRSKIYVNGSEISVTRPRNWSQNTDYGINNNTLTTMGTFSNSIGSYSFDGYMADIHFLDGYAYDPSYFGYTESQTGLWRPKKYEGAYGTNGFHLEFKDNSSTTTLGKDTSGNGNDFTLNNFSVSAGVGNDSLEDTPTNNFATLNGISPTSSTNGTLSNGNLEVTKADYIMHRANFIFGPGGIQSGKWYWEVTNVNSSNSNYANYTGITGDLTQDSGEVALQGNKSLLGSHFHKTYTATSGSERSNDGTNKTMQFLLDVDNQQLIAKYNGSTIYTDTSIPSASTTNYVPFVMTTNSGTGGSTWSDSHFNFGQRPFSYTPPTGYRTLCSKNLPPNVPSIIRPQKHFETVIYNGTGSTNKIESLEFAPDLVWVKRRNSTGYHIWSDTIRGASNYLVSNTTDQESVGGGSQLINGFLKDGFQVGTENAVNNGSGTYVAWCWKAGGTAVTNNDGSVASQVSANTEAGFSIVTFSGSGNRTIGHGLGKAPQVIIMKGRNVTDQWTVGHHKLDASDPWHKGIPLNTAETTQDNATFWNDTAPTSTVFSKGTWDDGYNIVAYCWTEIPGFSKFGKYMGNGNADGPFINLGFRPAWLLLRGTHADLWYLYDNKRNTFNVVDKELNPNRDQSEASFTTADFLSNGFKIRTSNSSFNYNNYTYLYMAFAEQPGTTSFETFPNAR